MTEPHSPSPRFESVEALEDCLSAPSPELIDDLSRVDGDVLILGVGGKMGPTLARMARRAAPHKRIVGVARFTDGALRSKLERHGVECIACDLLDRAAVQSLPRLPNVVFMAGQKFGTSGQETLTWAMNVAVPWIVAETFRESRIVAFSTACVYPYVDVGGTGASEALPAVPPPGEYANSCVGRERMFEFGSRRHGTPGRLVRLSYAIDLRYGVLHDVATAVWSARPIDVTMGWVNVIWQGDANDQALRLLAHCTTPTSPLNVTGPDKVGIRWLTEQFAERFGRPVVLHGSEAPSAWLIDTAKAVGLFGRPRVTLARMIDWTADWVARGGASLGKPTHFETRDGRY